MTALIFVGFAIFCSGMLVGGTIVSAIMKDHPACNKEDAMDTTTTRDIRLRYPEVTATLPPSLHRELQQLAAVHTGGDVGRMMVLVLLRAMAENSEALTVYQDDGQGFGRTQEDK